MADTPTQDVETIDGEPAAAGGRAGLSLAAGFFPDRSEMVLERSYGAEKR